MLGAAGELSSDIARLTIENDQLRAELAALKRDAECWYLREIKADVEKDLARQIELSNGRHHYPTGVQEVRCTGPELQVEPDTGWRVLRADVRIVGVLYEVAG